MIPVVALAPAEAPDPVTKELVVAAVDKGIDAPLFKPVLEPCIVFADPVAVPVFVLFPAVMLTH